MDYEKVIKCSQSNVKNQRIKTAYDLMSELLDIVDSMDEATYAEFELHVGDNFYTELSDGLQDLNSYVEQL